MNVISANRRLTGLVADTIAFSGVDGPGNRYVLFLQGCNFDCVACHNPQTIPGHAPMEGHDPRRLTVDDVLDEIRRSAPFIRGVTVSGGEATQQPAFLHALFAAIKADENLRHLTCFVDSNGACDPETWLALAPVMDGAMIDLKCFDPVIHQRMTSQPNDEVLRSIEQLHGLGLLHEVRLLLVSGVNDDPDLLHETAHWLAAIDPKMRLVLIGFRAHGTRPQHPPLVEPNAEEMRTAASVFEAVADFDLTVV